MTMVYFWLAVFFLMLLAEIVSLGLTSIWFAIGGAVAGVAAFLGADLWLQILVFAVASVVMLLLTRPFAVKYLNSRTKASNLDELVGLEVPVVETVDASRDTGKVKIQGSVWMAQAKEPETVIEEGHRCLVSAFSGAKVIVEKKEE